MKKFNIPQIEQKNKKKDEEIKDKPRENAGQFVSSIFGTKVKDEITFSGAQFGNKGRQYDAFREKDKRINKNDYKDYIIDYNPYEESRNKNYEYDNQYEDSSESVKDEYYQEITIKNDDIHEREIINEYDEIEKKAQDNEETHIDYEEKQVEVREEKPKQTIETKQVKTEKPKQKLKQKPKQKHLAPPLSLLRRGQRVKNTDNSYVIQQLESIDQTLAEFNIAGHVVKYTKGPTVTQFEVQLDPGVKVQKVKSVSSNLQADLRARSIRVQAPIPGKSTVGIEVPNVETELVLFGELLADNAFLNDGNPMNVVLGLGLDGDPVYLNLAKMPHCLIGGTTGSGKSVSINAMIGSLLYKAHPDDVKLILIDPKIIEFSNYEDLPHLATPVITEPKLAAAALKWAVEEMENRYQLFRTLKVREYEEYNQIAKNNIDVTHIPYIVIIVDELADLMLMAGNDVEDYIQRLTQKGRASGIHLIIATQRPSVDVIKGTIKTNIPTRIAFQVKTQIDSTIILDHSGAEKLLGNGDMLYNDSVSEHRIQGAFVSPQEIRDITNYIRDHSETTFMFTEEDLQEKLETGNPNIVGINDEYFQIIARFVVENQNASINRVQKTFGIGFNRAQEIMEALEELGIVSENLGSRAREVEVGIEELEGILDEI